MTDFKCTYCQVIIPTVRFSCAECKDFQLCIDCFTSGAEIGKHKSKHNYQIQDDGFRPIFTSPDSNAWTAKQESSLIEGIEHYGLGNWPAVTAQVGNKTEQDVKEHFSNHYVAGAIGVRTRLKMRKYNVVDHTGPVEGPLSPSITSPLPPVNLTKAEAMELGFLPFRDDFEREWDNEAETVLSSAMVHHTDDDLDIAYKLSLVSMYRLRLKERARRKGVARDFSIVNQYTNLFKKGQPGAKKRSVREYKEYTEGMKKFCRFMSNQEHDRYFNSLQKEKQIKLRIKELTKCRKNGITRLTDAEEFARESVRREKLKDKKIVKPPTRSLSPESLILPSRRSQNHTVADPITITPEKRKRIGLNGDETPEVQESKTPNNKSNLHTRTIRSDILTEQTQVEKQSRENSSLSDKEKKLCKKIGMRAASYVTLKTCILKDYLKRQHGTPVKLRFPTGFDKTHRRTILNFLEHSGWIQLEN